MGKMVEDMPIESSSKYDYLMDEVNEYITEMEDKECTRIACISRGLFDMHAWKETPYDIPLWMVYSDLDEVAYHIPYGSTNKIPYSSIDWVDRDIFGMKTLGGKEFYFCNKFFVVTDIILTCEQKQRIIVQPLDTSHTHAHEVHSDLHVLEEFEVKKN